MKNIISAEGKNPFWVIETLPDKPLFSDCPVRPPQDTIDAASDLYYKFGDKPTYVSVNDDHIVFEWHYYKQNGIKKELYYSKELIFKDPINLEWRTYDYGMPGTQM